MFTGKIHRQYWHHLISQRNYYELPFFFVKGRGVHATLLSGALPPFLGKIKLHLVG
jgi:hypothetical protein